LALFVFLFISIPAAVASFILEHRRRARLADANTRPYTWGYFQGCSGFIAGVYALIAVPYTLWSPDAESGAWLVWVGLASIWLSAGYFTIRRYRWAWVMNTIAMCNPLWWLIDWQYGRNRWAEFARISHD